MRACCCSASRSGSPTARRRGEPVRADDNPEVLKKRLDAYRVQTSPLINYYEKKGSLGTVDGMAPIADVARRSTV